MLAVIAAFLMGITSLKAQPPNDNCTSAIGLANGSLLCGQNATGSTLSNCFVDVAGSSESDMWYWFQATNDTMILQFLQTNATNCAPIIMVYGPFSSPTGGCGTAGVDAPPCNCGPPAYDFDITPDVDYQGTEGDCYLISDGDPGNYIPLYGLSVGSYYLVRIQNNNCGGPADRYVQFCIGIDEPVTNALPSSATLLDTCGQVYNGTTLGGYAGAFFCTAPGGYLFGDLNCDGNNDVNFVVNNPSWFAFCTGTAGTWQVDFTIGSCLFGDGGQIAIFLDTTGGSPSDMFTFEESTPSCGATGYAQIPPGCTWTSSIISLDSGDCVYLMVDGFGGDACNYELVLTNLTGGCILLGNLLNRLSISCNEGVRVVNWSGNIPEATTYRVVFKPAGELTEYVIAELNASNSNTFTIYDLYYYDQAGIYTITLLDANGNIVDKFSITTSACSNVKPLMEVSEGYLKIINLGNKCRYASLNTYDHSGQLINSIHIPCNFKETKVPLNTLIAQNNGMPSVITLTDDKGQLIGQLRVIITR